jgi:hypothetical protein
VSVIRRRATHNGLHAFFCKKEKNIIFVLKNQNNMQVITAKELRANQKKYFDLAENETIFVVRRKASPIMISVVSEECLSKIDLLSIKKGLEDIKEGRTVKINDIHKIWDDIL